MKKYCVLKSAFHLRLGPFHLDCINNQHDFKGWGENHILAAAILGQWRRQQGRGTGGPGPLQNLGNFLSQIAGISSVKYSCCPGRRALLVGYSPEVPVTQRQRQLHAWSMCSLYRTEYVRQGNVIAGEFEHCSSLTSNQNSLVSSQPSLAILATVC